MLSKLLALVICLTKFNFQIIKYPISLDVARALSQI
jgi:hypothetical protein